MTSLTSFDGGGTPPPSLTSFDGGGTPPLGGFDSTSVRLLILGISKLKKFILHLPKIYGAPLF